MRGEQEWQDWDLPRLVTALKKWKDIHTLDEGSNESTKPKPDSQFFLTKDGERKKRPCVYCEESTHLSKDCSNVLTVLAEKNVVLTVPALNNVLRTVRATLIVKSVIKNIILPFVQKSCHY